MSNSDDSPSPPDHRDLGNSLDLFHFQDDAPGMVFWHPRGFALYNALRDAARRRCVAEGYSEVMTPQVLRESIWQRSGHWTHYHEDMFGFDDALAYVLRGAGLRVGVDSDPDTLGRRIVRAHTDSVPFAVILGDREVATRSATIRQRGGENRLLSEADAADFLVNQCRPPL